MLARLGHSQGCRAPAPTQWQPLGSGLPANVLKTRGRIAPCRHLKAAGRRLARAAQPDQNGTDPIVAEVKDTPASGGSGTLDNVAEARRWIAAWKERRAVSAAEGASAAPATSANVDGEASSVAVSQAEGYNGSNGTGTSFAPAATEAEVAQRPEGAAVTRPAVAADGTILYRKAYLDSCSYEEAMEVLQRRVEGLGRQ